MTLRINSIALFTVNVAFLSLVIVDTQGRKRGSMRHTRWGSKQKAVIEQQTHLPTDWSDTQIRQYLTVFNAAYINHQLKTNSFVTNQTNSENRSPSPDPVYDQTTHRRINTREARQQRKLYKEMDNLVQKAKSGNPKYVPPNWKPKLKIQPFQQTIILPTSPKRNYAGAILGPKGTTIQAIQKDTGTWIRIRGKGFRSDESIESSEDDDNERVTVLVSSYNANDLRMGVGRIQEIINLTKEEPDNELKRRQMTMMD